MKKALSATLSLLLYALSASQVFAAEGDPTPTPVSTIICKPIYGGGQTCDMAGNIMLDKKVQHPQSGVFVDNLAVNDAKYLPDQPVSFQISITNTGSQTSGKITVKDRLPQFVAFVAGPGNYDPNTKTLTFEISDLKSNEARTFTLTGKAVSANDLPKNQGVTCVVNQSQATTDGKTSQDNAQLCIEKQVLGVTPPVTLVTKDSLPIETKGGLKIFPAPQVNATPPTGPEVLALIGLIPTGALGFFLRKKAS